MFQELLSAVPTPESSRVGIPAPSGFQPLFAARQAVLDGPSNGRHASVDREAGGAPHVELVEENGKVVRIVVTCSCCERIELECEY